MPVYEFYECEACKPGSTDRIEVVRPISEASKPEFCGACRKELSRAYSLAVWPEFQPYYDEKAGKEIRTYGDERRMMKKEGRIYTRDIPKSDRIKEQLRIAKFKRDRGL